MSAQNQETRLSILEKIFTNNLTKESLNTKRFRVQNRDHLDLIDSLVHANDIIQSNDKYYLRIDSLFEIADFQSEAREYIDQARSLFLLLQNEYQQDPEKSLTLTEIAKKSTLSREQVIIILYYLIDAPGIVAGRTTDLTQPDAYICPAESILKYKSLDDLVNKFRSWREPVESIEHESLVSPNVNNSTTDFSFLLHPEIIKHALTKYHDGHLRNAVLDSMTAVFDFIRSRTNLDDDGDRLIGRVFSLEDPMLVLSEIDTESGRNDQKGFIQIFKGAYQGIRNPKAHRLENDLSPLKAAQYMIFASMLIRRIEDAKLVKPL